MYFDFLNKKIVSAESENVNAYVARKTNDGTELDLVVYTNGKGKVKFDKYELLKGTAFPNGKIQNMNC